MNTKVTNICLKLDINNLSLITLKLSVINFNLNLITLKLGFIHLKLHLINLNLSLIDLKLKGVLNAKYDTKIQNSSASTRYAKNGYGNNWGKKL